MRQGLVAACGVVSGSTLSGGPAVTRAAVIGDHTRAAVIAWAEVRAGRWYPRLAARAALARRQGLVAACGVVSGSTLSAGPAVTRAAAIGDRTRVAVIAWAEVRAGRWYPRPAARAAPARGRARWPHTGWFRGRRSIEIRPSPRPLRL